MIRNFKILGIVGIIAALGLSAPALADGGGGSGFSFRPNSGGGNGGFHGGIQNPPSNQQLFFNQTSNRQQSFFAQPVFPHSNFNQNQGLQQGMGNGFQFNAPAFQGNFVPSPVLPQQVWTNPPANSTLPPSFYYGAQPGFYVAPTQFNAGNTTTIQPGSTQVFTTQQPTTIISTGSPHMTPGLIGRW